MIENNDLETLRKQTWLKQQREDGILDIMLGVFLMFVSIFVMAKNISGIAVYIALFPLLGKSLKRRFVFPRTDKALFTKQTTEKRNTGIWIVAAILVAGMVGFLVSINYKSVTDTLNPLFNVMGIIISGMVILGGVSRLNVLYLYAILLGIPMSVLQCMHRMWLGMSIVIGIVVILFAAVMWMIVKGRKQTPDDVLERPALVAHAYLVEAGIVFFAYFLLATYFPEFSQWIKTGVFENSGLILGNLFALLVFALGIAYMAVRFYLYAVVISIIFILYDFLALSRLTPAMILCLAGLAIAITGILLLRSFVVRNPVLERNAGA